MSENLPQVYPQQISEIVNVSGGSMEIKLDPAATGYSMTFPPTNSNGILSNSGTGILSWIPGGGGGEVNTASNVGNAGVGVFNAKVGVDLQFKKIHNASPKISVVDDIPDSEVRLDVVESALMLSNLGGTLGVAKGGTGATSLTSNNFLVGAGAGAVTTTKVAPAGVVVGTTDTQTISNKFLSDSTVCFQNAVDATKKVLFQLSGVPTATTNTISFPGVDGTMVLAGATQTLTNKTLTTPIIAAISNTGTLTLPTSTDTLVGRATTDTLTNKTLTAPILNAVPTFSLDDTNSAFALHLESKSGIATTDKKLTFDVFNGDRVIAVCGDIKTSAAFTTLGAFPLTLTQIAPSSVTMPAAGTLATLAGAETLTNKTLTTPAIAAISNGGTITLPTSTDTLVGRDTTDTLTNKTLTAPTLNAPSIAGATALSLDDTGSSFNLGLVSTSAPVMTGGGKNLTFNVKNGDRKLAIGGDIDTAAAFTTSGAFSLTLVQTASTNVTLPTSGTLATLSGVETLSNKTFGSDLNMNNFKITILGPPTATTDAATKGYVDSVATGITVKASSAAATTAALSANASLSAAPTYNPTGGVSLSGQFTATLVVSNVFTVDGITFNAAANGSRILVKNQVSAAENGIWTTTVSGTNLTLDRATDFDGGAGVTSGSYTFVTQGTTQANSGWLLTTMNPITVGGAGGSPLVFQQFSSAETIIAGNGLDKTGSTISAVGSATVISSPSGLSVNSSATSNQILLSSGTVGTASAFGALPLGNTNSVVGILAVSNGGTGAATHTSGNFLIGAGASAVTSAKVAPAGAVVGTTDTQTLTNKTLTAPTINGGSLVGATVVSLDDTNSTFNLSLVSTSGLGADHTLTFNTNGVDRTISMGGGITTAGALTTTGAFPLTLAQTASTAVTLPTTGTLATLDGAETFTNKTLTTPIISVISNGGTLTLPTGTDTLVGRATTDTLTNKTLTTPIIAAISNTGTLTLPTSTDTLVGRATTDTLTNKTLTLPVISSLTNGAATITMPAVTGTLATLDGTETFTNKTLTTPIIAAISNTGTLTLPTSTDTLVGRATTDTLTNKTLTAPILNAVPTFSLDDTNSAFNLVLESTSAITTADKKLTFNVNDASRSISLLGDFGTGGSLFTAGAFPLTLTQTASTNVTLPPTGTLATLAGTETFTNKTATSNTNNLLARGLWIGSGSGSVSTFAAAAPTTGQILTATSGTLATWQAPATSFLANNYVSSVAVTTTTAVPFVVFATGALSITPATAGTYLVEAGGYASNSSAAGNVSFGVFVNGVAVSGGSSLISGAAGRPNEWSISLTVAYTTGAIDVRWGTSAGTATCNDRRLVVVRLGS